MTIRDTKLLNICSVSPSLPSKISPASGTFVSRRLEAISQMANIRAVLANPWFPFIKRTDQPLANVDFETIGVDIPYLPMLMKHLDRRWFHRALMPVIKRLHGNEKIDVLDSHFGYPTGAAVCKIGKTLGIPAFVTLRGVEQVQLHTENISKQLKECFEEATGIITVSHSLRNVAVDAGADKRKIAVIPNAVDTTRFYPGNKRKIRKELGISQKGPVIVSAGRLVPGKGHHILLDAFHRVLNDFPDAKLIIVGGEVYNDRRYPNDLKEKITKLSLESAVTLAGSQPQQRVAEYIRAADVFALATNREGCCNVILEALASGTPVVTTPVGDNTRYVFNHENGFIFDIDDSQDFSSKLSCAINTNWDQDAITDAVAGHTWDDVATSVLDFMGSRT